MEGQTSAEPQTPRRLRKPPLRRIGWAAVVVWLALYFVHQAYDPLKVTHGFRGTLPGLHCNDFKHIYLGAVLLRYRTNPYDAESLLGAAGAQRLGGVNPYVYPPTTGVLLRPLSYLPFGHVDPKFPNAKMTWFILNHVMLLGALAICVHVLFGLRDPWPIALALLLAATSFPLRRTFTAGQLNCLLLLIYSGILWAVARRREWAAGLFVALGALIKLMSGIFVLYFLLKRRWRALAWTCGWGVVILGVSIAAGGWRNHLAYLPVMRQMGYGRSVWEERLIAGATQPFYRDPFNQSFNSLFHHLLAPDPLRALGPSIRQGDRLGVILADGSWKDLVQPWADSDETAGRRLANGLTILCALIAFALAAWALRGCRRPEAVEPDASRLDEAIEVALVVALSLLIPSIMWDHYAMLLILPQLALVAAYCRAEKTPYIQFGLLIAAGWLLGQPFAYHHPKYTYGAGLLVMSEKLYGVLILFGLLTYQVRRRRGLRGTREPGGSTTLNPADNGFRPQRRES